MKIIRKLLLGLVLSSYATVTFSAIEYLRFEGQIFDFYLDDLSVVAAGIDTPLVYFDFAIDTEQVVEAGGGFSYAADLLAGSAGSASNVFALESSLTPEGRKVALGFNQTSGLHIALGLDQVFARRERALISNWVVGDVFDLWWGGVLATFDESDGPGYVRLTYRADTPPSAFVPLPSGLFLFVGALGALRAVKMQFS